MKNNKLVAAFAAAGLIASGSALAATQGSMGVGASATSTGSSLITLNVPNMIKISGLSDVTLTHNAAAGQFDGTTPACVYRNITGNYAVTANSTNGGGSGFTLSDGAGDTVAYNVDWNGTTLTDGTMSTTFTGGADTTSTTCGGTPNVNVTVSATDAQVGAATATGTYNDTLSLVVSAQ